MSHGITRVGLIAKHGLTAASGVLADLARWLEARAVRAIFEAETARLAGAPAAGAVTREALPSACDLIVVLGGDGTLIGVATLIARAGVDVPILGVNYGNLGFLTEITLPELYDALEAALDGSAKFTARAMLHAQVTRAEALFAEHIVLNDVGITRAAMSRIIEVEVSVDDEPVTRVRADGLIVASPTGSTAYNLAAGGPIVHSSVDALILTPVAPHTLTSRPVVIPASCEIHIRPVMERSDEVWVTFDGQSGFALQASDAVTIRRARRLLRVIKSDRRSYFELLREKLKWGERR